MICFPSQEGLARILSTLQAIYTVLFAQGFVNFVQCPDILLAGDGFFGLPMVATC